MADERDPPDVDPGEESTRSLLTSGVAGNTLGPYRLLQKVGEGGMGEVWLAEQSAPIRRQVALKVIKAGMDTKQVVARFEAERQALALMDHPAIAHVYDAGETDRGLPYFAMEYVKGEPITSYCDRHRLPLRERMELLMQVCDGVQHAHQKGVIHRDLKPSNVLVTVQAEKPVSKVIDFGVAKAIAQKLTEKTMFTELGVLIGTPEYMSPEQSEMTGLDIDTRTDVYALGIILYQLLAGALPFDPAELRKAGFDEIRRKIREVDPPRPSSRISTMGEASSESAHNRRTEPAKLASLLKGDLDWITMKALEKDRTRRYASPSELAADIARHLRHEPVLAGPPSALYRARKFVRRHRVGVALGVVGVLALVGFAATMAVQADRIAREKNRAERVSEFLVDLFKVSDPSEARGNKITAREILDKGADKIRKELGDEPEVQAQLMVTMGTVYTSLGLYKQAEPLLQQSLQIRRRLHGESDVDTLTSMKALAELYLSDGRWKESQKLHSHTFELRRALLGEDHPDTLQSKSDLAVSYERLGQYDEAGRLHRQVLEARRRVLGEEDPGTIWSMQDLAVILGYQGHNAEAEKLYRKALDASIRVRGADHPDTLWIMNNLGGFLMLQHRNAEAEKLLLQTLDMRLRVLGEENPRTLATMSNLASVYTEMGRYDAAGKILEKVLELRGRTLGEEHPTRIQVMLQISYLYSKQGNWREAEDLCRTAIGIARRALGEDHPVTIDSHYMMAALAVLHGDRPAGIGQLREAIDHGFSDPTWLAADADFQSLHGDPAFEALLEAARKNKVETSSPPDR